ncbi:uncharacterized protein METZ01_LOCUS301475 [marine metagenome]|uniref:HMA domain-containing protein n=1 Tax=marine metagenome TaxID=408172 RepID=A0A382MMT4_9ZZZZ
MKTLFITLSTLGFLFSGESTATYKVDGMMCAINCPKKVNNSLDGIDGIKSCKVDFESKTTTVVYNDEIIDSDKIGKTIAEKTYYKVKDITRRKPTTWWGWLLSKK